MIEVNGQTFVEVLCFVCDIKNLSLQEWQNS
jgi:hypothetical protein